MFVFMANVQSLRSDLRTVKLEAQSGCVWNYQTKMSQVVTSVGIAFAECPTSLLLREIPIVEYSANFPEAFFTVLRAVSY